MNDFIDLPPLPESCHTNGMYMSLDMKHYAIEAIKADRQQRGEPVAWMHKNSLLSLHGDPAKDRVQLQTYLTRAQTSEEQMPLYVAPQPAAPAQKECSKGAERPEQECSDARQCWEPCGELGKSEGHAKVAPAQEPSAPEGWQLVPVEPDTALLVSMATCLYHGFGLLDEGRQDSMLHDMRKLHEEVLGKGYYSPENRERYLSMLEAAPKFGEEQ